MSHVPFAMSPIKFTVRIPIARRVAHRVLRWSPDTCGDAGDGDRGEEDDAHGPIEVKAVRALGLISHIGSSGPLGSAARRGGQRDGSTGEEKMARAVTRQGDVSALKSSFAHS